MGCLVLKDSIYSLKATTPEIHKGKFLFGHWDGVLRLRKTCDAAKQTFLVKAAFALFPLSVQHLITAKHSILCSSSNHTDGKSELFSHYCLNSTFVGLTSVCASFCLRILDQLHLWPCAEFGCSVAFLGSSSRLLKQGGKL